jgi:transcriptional antiterminator
VPFEERFHLLIESGQADERSSDAAQRALAEVEKHYAVRLDLGQELGASLATHLAITLKRLMEGQALSEVPETVWKELEDYPEELEFAATLAGVLEGVLDLSLPRDEIGFIAVHLCRIRMESNREIASNDRGRGGSDPGCAARPNAQSGFRDAEGDGSRGESPLPHRP